MEIMSELNLKGEYGVGCGIKKSVKLKNTFRFLTLFSCSILLILIVGIYYSTW